jgi:hypothetical protein
VTLKRDSKDGKLAFSIVRVAGVEERNNFREFSETKPQAKEGLGSLGDLLRSKLGIEAPAQPPEPPAAPPRSEPASTTAPLDTTSEPVPDPPAPPPKPATQAASGAPEKVQAQRLERAGVVRRRKN